MKFTYLVALLTTVVSASALVVVPPISTPHGSDVIGRCNGCGSGEGVLKLVHKLRADVHSTLALLDNCRDTGNNPTNLFVELASKVDQCNSAMATVKVDSIDQDSKTAIQVQVSDVAAKIILDISAGCSQFQNVKLDGFEYAKLSSDIDTALKILSVTLDEHIKGCLKLISSICLPKSVLLSAANFKECLTTFASFRLNLW